MGAIETGLLKMVADLSLIADGIGALCMVGVGFYYMMARGNPRGQGAAFSWLMDIGKGMLAVNGAVLVTQWLSGNLKWG